MQTKTKENRMIHYEKFILDNGLRVIVHKDESTPLVAVNILYGVGAKHENEDKTGFAHLFEHLMFGGSENVPDFDDIIEKIGGENNAFTNNDYTNYYLTVPNNQLETALWVESDRMAYLYMSQESLDVQKNVVIEEYKQRYLNQPYGDVWMLIREQAYTKHPYRWSTIGKDISHIEDANLDDVKNFYQNYYNPNNAILCVAGNVDSRNVKALCEKWFSEIPKKDIAFPIIEKEPLQIKPRRLEVKRDVPQSAIYLSFPMSSRLEKEYYAFDLLSDILSNGRSSRLYNALVKDKEIFTEVNAFISGDIDDGLFMVTGKYRENVSIEEGEKAIWEELRKIAYEKIEQQEFEKVKNKFESTMTFSQLKALDRAMNLCYFEYLGNIDQINKEVDLYHELDIDFIQELAKKTFVEEKSNTLLYLSK